MKSIIQIFLKDLKVIFRNISVIIVIVALMILPSLYAWFNIKASWDPYGQKSTSGIKIGVVNQDKGATVEDKEVNLGERIVDELKKNNQMGWQFVNEDKAMKALRDERYYAVITIPEDFSSNLSSITSSDIKKGTIIYTVNEKMNAVAPKLTDKGVTNLQSMISQTVVETVSKTIFAVSNELGIDLEEQIPNLTKAYDSLLDLQSRFDDINATIKQADQGITKLDSLLSDVKKELPKITDTITSAKKFSEELMSYITVAKETTAKVSPMISKNLSLYSAMAEELNGKISVLQDAIASNSDNVPQLIAQTKQQIAFLNKASASALALLERINAIAANTTISQYIGYLTDAQGYLNKMEGLIDKIAADVASGDYTPGQYVDQIAAEAGKASAALSKLKDVESKLTPALGSVFDQAYTIAEQAQGILKDAEAKIPEVKSLLNIGFESTKKGKEGIATVKKVVPEAEKMVDEFVEKLKLVKDEGNLNELVELLKSDVTKRSDFLANPVTIDQQRLYPIANYGTGMTPFYTVLSLWVGILLLVSILSVGTHGEYRPYQVYFGKMLLFLLITIVQALVVSLGDLYLLKITCMHPFLFVVGCVATSIVFTVIVYSLVSVLGNVGKVISIILLVLQVAGSGGTFPIQLTPTFFQVINPFLPFTYSISFTRETIGGIVEEILVRDVIAFGAYIAVALVFSVILKKPANRMMRKFNEQFKESGIGTE